MAGSNKACWGGSMKASLPIEEILRGIAANDMQPAADELQERVNALSEIEYEQRRKELAAEYGVRTSALDKLRKKPEAQKQGKVLKLEDPIPAPDPQDGRRLLDDLAVQIERFIAADASSIDAMALWAVFAHIADRAAVCPNLAFVSATKACGKSTALDVVSRLMPRAINIANITPAALFRVIEAAHPSLIIDEADTMFRQNEELRCLLNAGFTRSAAQVLRTVGDDYEPRMFTVWAPKAFALIGRLPDTLESRSVVIHMRRRLPDEEIERLRADQDQGFSQLQSRISRFVLDNVKAILNDEPELPEALTDRQADVWRELFRIADIAGAGWPDRARRAALELCAKSDDDGDLSIRLLADLQTIFAELPERDMWPSQAIVDALNGLEEAPWAEMNNGKGLTTNRLARMLQRFEIKTKTVRIGNRTPKGYTAASFADIFARYLPNNRNTQQNSDNSLQNSNIKCCGNVFVADGNRNIHEKGCDDDSMAIDEGSPAGTAGGDDLGIF